MSVSIRITAEDAKERLDKVIAARLATSRATVQRWIDDGRVTLRGLPVRARDKARDGDTIEVVPAPPPPSRAEPEAIPLTILFEDADLLVVDKPAGLVVHPGAGHQRGTLVNAVLHHTRVEDDSRDAMRPGIVHRLDKDTSGILVIAKSIPARDGLVQALSKHDVERRYRAIVVGSPPSEITLDTLHGRHPSDRKRFTTKVARGRRAVTHMRVIERFVAGAALVECRLETGRTHQIRVHTSEAGYPILGDATYGRTPAKASLRPIAAALGRQALHAAVLGFVHPRTRKAMRFESDVPEDFRAALEKLAALR